MRPTARPGLRLLCVFFAFLAASVVIGGRLVFVQGMGSDRFAALAADQRERRFVQAPQRGSILDRYGAELALSVDTQTVVANPRFVPDPAAAAGSLAPVLGANPRTLAAKLSRKAGFVYLARKIDGAKAEQVRALRIPGVEVFAEAKRVYPAGRLASHVVGFAGMDNEGLEGLERHYDAPLRGRPGELLMERDPSGRSIPMGKYHFKPPVPGDDLVLTIDREIQYEAEKALADALQAYHAQGGSIIVLVPTTGEILALANLPDYDPNRPGDSAASNRKNRALVDVYEPGSANKVITAAAAIETGVIRPDDVVRVPDKFKLSTKTFHD
ncbi:MAG: peptidoglycan D,D-transpeptidase FtsI family protein, partial [Anaerolineales bacterium]